VAVYTGISPTGLNASSEGEIRIFENTIHAYQEARFRRPLNHTIEMCMLSLWGEVDDDIVYDFVPLREMTEKETAEINKLKAETGDLLMNGSQAIGPQEERNRIAGDPDSGYDNIDPEEEPELPEPDPLEEAKLSLSGHAAAGAGPGAKKQAAANQNGKAPPKAANDMAWDIEWNEGDHPREPDGKFASGGGGSSPVHVVAKSTEWGKPVIMGAHGSTKGAVEHRAQANRKARTEAGENAGEPLNHEEWGEYARRNPHEVTTWHAGTGGISESGETHVVATGEHDPDEGNTGRVKVHGAYASSKEAEHAANTVAERQWAEHGDLVENNGELWASESDRLVAEWNKKHGTDYDAEQHSSLPKPLQAAIEEVGAKPLPYPGLKKAIAYWRRRGDYDHVIPVIRKLQMGPEAANDAAWDEDKAAGLRDALLGAYPKDGRGYLKGIKGFDLSARQSEWHAQFDADADRVTIYPSFWEQSEDKRVQTLLHEAGHRGQQEDAPRFARFKAEHVATLPNFVAIANDAHLEDFERKGKVDGLAAEVWAESYARHCLGLKMPKPLAEFWKS